MHWTQTDGYFVVGNAYRLLPSLIYCGWQWPSIDTLYNLLWLANAIDGHGSQSIVAGSGHRWTRSTWWTICIIYIYIDWPYHQSTVADNIYRYIFPLVYCRRQYLLIDSSLVRCLRHLSMETFHSLLPPTTSSDRFVPRSLSTIYLSIDTFQSTAADNIYRYTYPLVYCRRQYLSIGTSQSITADNIYRYISALSIVAHNIDIFLPRLLSLTRSIDRFLPRLLPKQ